MSLAKAIEVLSEGSSLEDAVERYRANCKVTFVVGD